MGEKDTFIQITFWNRKNGTLSFKSDPLEEGTGFHAYKESVTHLNRILNPIKDLD